MLMSSIFVYQKSWGFPVKAKIKLNIERILPSAIGPETHNASSILVLKPPGKYENYSESEE